MTRRRRQTLAERVAAALPPLNGSHRREVDPPPDPPAGVGYAEWLFSNPTKLSRLANLMKHDPAAFAVERDRLKRRSVSLADLNRALRRIASAIPDPTPARPARPLYTKAHGRIWRNAPAGDGQVALCTFTARIVADVTSDDGAGECRRHVRVAGTLDTGEELPEVEVTAEQFQAMRWPFDAWGHRAVVFPGQGEHLMTALQMLSGDVRRETVYTHTGWREVNGRWVYLHAGGATGPAGPVPGVRVSLPHQLAGFALPPPPAGGRRREAVRASLGLMRDLAHDAVAVPLLIAPYRAALGGADYTVALVGQTTIGKTALAQQRRGIADCGLWISD